jgi:putative endonuclease
MVRFYWTYILRCSDGSYYVGITNNMDQRLEQHQSGTDSGAYTFTRRPVELVYQNMSMTPDAAIELEKKLKGWSRAKKEALINGEFELLQKLSKKKFNK